MRSDENYPDRARTIGDGYPVYFVADLAANHDGKLERAYSLIDLAKEAGADAAKFQNFQAAKIVSRHGFEALPGMSHQAAWKKPVFEVYEDASIPQDWTQLLKRKCDEVGIEYFTSPYDFASVDHVDPYVRMYKIGSGDITWPGILEHVASKGKPVMLATGASTMEDVERAMEMLTAKTDKLVLMQCNTNYTASTENFRFINLNVLKKYAARWPDTILGLSDHTHGHATVLGAIALGARVIEKHFTDDNGRAGPDHEFAMNPRTWREIVESLARAQSRARRRREAHRGERAGDGSGAAARASLHPHAQPGRGGVPGRHPPGSAGARGELRPPPRGRGGRQAALARREGRRGGHTGASRLSVTSSSSRRRRGDSGRPCGPRPRMPGTRRLP